MSAWSRWPMNLHGGWIVRQDLVTLHFWLSRDVKGSHSILGGRTGHMAIECRYQDEVVYRSIYPKSQVYLDAIHRIKRQRAAAFSLHERIIVAESYQDDKDLLFEYRNRTAVGMERPVARDSKKITFDASEVNIADVYDQLTQLMAGGGVFYEYSNAASLVDGYKTFIKVFPVGIVTEGCYAWFKYVNCCTYTVQVLERAQQSMKIDGGFSDVLRRNTALVVYMFHLYVSAISGFENGREQLWMFCGTAAFSHYFARGLFQDVILFLSSKLLGSIRSPENEVSGFKWMIRVKTLIRVIGGAATYFMSNQLHLNAPVFLKSFWLVTYYHLLELLIIFFRKNEFTNNKNYQMLSKAFVRTVEDCFLFRSTNLPIHTTPVKLFFDVKRNKDTDPHFRTLDFLVVLVIMSAFSGQNAGQLYRPSWAMLIALCSRAGYHFISNLKAGLVLGWEENGPPRR